jgi:phenylacetate-CoA ligase
MTLRQIIKPLPYPLRQGIKYVYGLLPPRIRYGRVFWETYNFLQESQWWSREKLEEYQMQQLSKMLHHAYQNVPYYRRIFDERGLRPQDIQNSDDLKKLPFLSKDDFKNWAEYLLARNFNPNHLRMTHTSGTTGKPLQFFEDPLTAEKEWAFICHQWSRVGYRPGDSRVEIRGPVTRDNPVYYDPVLRVLRLSPLIENREQARYYLEKIQSVEARFIHGYPGAIASLALLAKKHGLLVPFTLKAVLFASEKVYPWQ